MYLRSHVPVSWRLVCHQKAITASYVAVAFMVGIAFSMCARLR